MPRKTFVAGEILTAADVNTNLMDQAVMVFDDAAARDAAIPSPIEGMVAYLKNTDSLFRYTTSWGVVNTGFTASTTLTATNASFSVPTLGAPIVKVTVIGGGGGGGRVSGAGGTGGTTTFNAGGGGTVTAAGGAGASADAQGTTGGAGFRAGNGGGGYSGSSENGRGDGVAGQVVVGYLNLTGVSTVNVTVGAGGTASGLAAPGGRGEVIVEYVAA
jgi:hypothetical protein